MYVCSSFNVGLFPGGEGEVVIVRLIALVSSPNIDTVLAEKNIFRRE